MRFFAPALRIKLPKLKQICLLSWETRKMAHWLRLLSALAEDTGLGLLTLPLHGSLQTICPPISSFDLCGHHTYRVQYIHTHMQGNSHTDKIKILNKKITKLLHFKKCENTSWYSKGRGCGREASIDKHICELSSPSVLSLCFCCMFLFGN